MQVRPAGRPAGHRHGPGRAAECRAACWSTRHAPPPPRPGAECQAVGWSTGRTPSPPRPGGKVPSVQVRTLYNPPYPVTVHVARQSAESAGPAGWMTLLCPPHTRPGAECRSAGWSTPRDTPPPMPLDRVPCVHLAGWTTHLCPPPPRPGAECRAACWSTHRAPSPPRSGGKMPSVQVRPAGQPSGAHRHPCQRQSAKCVSPPG